MGSENTVRGTREWAVAEINCSTGCPHGCRYCYARAAAVKKGSVSSPEQWRQSRVLEEEVAREQPLYPGQVMFPTAHDIVPETIDSSVKVLRRLLAAGNRVLIVSKPSVSCIRKLCREFSGHRHNILFRFTITARNSDILSFWEPGAPSYRERLEALKLAYRKRYETSISIEPMLDIDDVEGLVGEVEPYVSHSIWLGKMNRIEQRVVLENETMISEVARIKDEQRDSKIQELYSRLCHNTLIRWKESIKEVIGLPLPDRPGLDL